MTTQSAVPSLDSRTRARAVLILFAVTLTMGIVLLVAFEPEIQTIDADSVSEGPVDAAHSLEVPKTTLFVAGTLFAIAANVRAAGALRKR